MDHWYFFNRCIGTIQHLKGKYGQGYTLEVKLREELTGLQQVALLHKEILRIFPHAARQERWGNPNVPVCQDPFVLLAVLFSRNKTEFKAAAWWFHLQLYYFNGVQDPHGGCQISGHGFLWVGEWWVTPEHPPTLTHTVVTWVTRWADQFLKSERHLTVKVLSDVEFGPV